MMNAMSAAAAQVRVWVWIQVGVRGDAVSMSVSMGARWVPGHCACLAQPGPLVCFHLVLAVASVVSRLRTLDAHTGLQALLGQLVADSRSLGASWARHALLLPLTPTSSTSSTASRAALTKLHLHRRDERIQLLLQLGDRTR